MFSTSTNSRLSNLLKMGPTFCPFVVILVLLHVASTAGRILITPAPHFPHPSSATKGFNAKHAALLDQRGFQDCDGGHGLFTCQTGTCYSGADGYVRCCSMSSYAPQTICFEYGDSAGSNCVNKDTDGCLSCSNSARRMCYTSLNIENYQSAIYCNSVGGIFTSFMNIVTGDSTAMAAVSTTFVTGTDTITVSASPAVSSDSLDSRSDNPANAPSFGQDGSSAQSASIAGVINPSNLPSIIPATSAFSTASTDSSNSNLPRGAIIGIAIGSGLTCIFLVITTMLLFLRQRRKNEEVVNSSSIRLKKIPAYDQNTPRNSDPDNTMVESISPRSPREPRSPTSLNPHPMSPQLGSREVSTTSELDSTPVSPITSQIPSTIAGYPSTTTYPSSSVGSRGYGQTLPTQLTSGLGDGQLHQSNSQLSFFVRSNPTGSPVSPVFPHASTSNANECTYGGTSMSDPPK